jgi:hypothetical protein
MTAALTPRSPLGWRIAAGFVVAANLLVLTADVARGRLGYHDLPPALALVPYLLYTVGGQSLLARVLPVFERKR